MGPRPYDVPPQDMTLRPEGPRGHIWGGRENTSMVAFTARRVRDPEGGS